MVILMSAGIMYLLLHNSGSGKPNAYKKPMAIDGDTLSVKKIFIKETGIHEMLINQLLW